MPSAAVDFPTLPVDWVQASHRDRMALSLGDWFSGLLFTLAASLNCFSFFSLMESSGDVSGSGRMNSGSPGTGTDFVGVTGKVDLGAGPGCGTGTPRLSSKPAGM